MSDLVAALLDAAWMMAARGVPAEDIAQACGIDRATAQDVVSRYRTYAYDQRIGKLRHAPVSGVEGR